MDSLLKFFENNSFVFAILAFIFLGISVALYLLYRKKSALLIEKEKDDQRALNEAYLAANSASNTKSDFLANMSHDIRTPMNAIVGMVAIAGANLDNRERLKDCLKKINSSLKHLLGIVNNVLDMSKIESGNMKLIPETFDLESLMAEIFDITKPLSETKNLTLQFPNFSLVSHKVVLADRQRLGQVFMNLLSNAFKFTPNGGRIAVQVHEAPTESQNSNCYEFSFEDTGCGMDEEFLKKIFLPFEKTGEKGKKLSGTGLGLAISKNIVEMMGGNLTVKSKVNEGSTFTVTLFLKPADMPTENTEELFSAEKYKKRNFDGKKILLVEDIDINAEIESEILKMIGFTVELAVNGKDAVEKIQTKGENYYDIIFMDIQMPEMDGYEATKTIRSLDSNYAKHLPIIAMTANTFADDIARAKESGMDEHIAKPLQIDLMMKILERWLG